MKKHVIVGTGIRGIMDYAVPMEEELADVTRLVAVCDINPKRAALVSEYVGREIPVYTDFTQMIKNEKPNTVIVTTKDCMHAHYIAQAMELGCDVVSEKPLTTDEEKLRLIAETKERTGRDLKLCFNLRFHPFYSQIKRLMMTGFLGEIYSVHYEWMLSPDHGASFMRRWHRERKNSGSLLIHKCTHHFDLINWFIDQNPVSVNAFGEQRFYGPKRKERSVRCYGCPYAKSCEYFWDITKNEFCRRAYFECEDVDGYYRDGCVFSDDIDIEDNVCVNVKYDKGAVMSYTFTATSQYEGINIHINGQNGRLEITHRSRLGEKRTDLVFYDRFNNNRNILEFPDGHMNEQGHMGSDTKYREMIFKGYTEDPLKQVAGLKEGAMSIGIGIAANHSMKEHRSVDISDIYKGINLEA